VTPRPRSAEPRPAVAVTGAGSGLGAALLARLAARDDLGALYALAPAPGTAPGAVWRRAGARDPRLAARLAGATTVVHLDTSYDLSAPAAERSLLNRSGTANVLAAARAAGVRRVVLATSAEVYGAAPDNPVPLPDRAPLRREADDTTLGGDHVEVERLAAHAARAGLAVTVLRPASLVGGRLGPAYDGHLLRLLSAPRLLAVRGVEPLWQLCHVDDLLAALELAAVGAVSGRFGVGSDGGLPQSRVEALAARRRLELPAAVALGTAERLHRAGVTTSSPRELDHVLGPLVVAADGLSAAGWRPGWTNEEAVRSHVTGRGSDVRVAATAAGATVALLGTAALVRRARRRRRR
jgi:nucleoside-diphosphate-sugar epimerase